MAARKDNTRYMLYRVTTYGDVEVELDLTKAELQGALAEIEDEQDEIRVIEQGRDLPVASQTKYVVGGI